MIKGLIKGNFHGNIVRRVDLELGALLLVPGLPPHLPTRGPEPRQQDLGYTSREYTTVRSGFVVGWVVERVCLCRVCRGEGLSGLVLSRKGQSWVGLSSRGSSGVGRIFLG